MKKDIKAKWLKALRSGKYKQTKQGYLRHLNSYCCLGVLCDLAIKDQGGSWKHGVNTLNPDSYACTSKNGKTSDRFLLPNWVRKWAGIKSKYGYMYESKSLTQINDDTNSTFKDIADIIEKRG